MPAARTQTERLSTREPRRETVPHLPHLRRAEHLAEDRLLPRRSSSSLGIVGCPSSDVPTRVHSPRASSGLDRSVCLPTTALVPPLWDLTTSTVYSAAWVPGLLHPGTGPGVRWVSVKPAVTARRQLGRGPHSHQRHTLRRFTLRRQPYPIAEVRSLLTVQTRSGAERHPTAEPAWTNGVSPCVSRSDRACATGDGWAFPPLRHHARAALARRSRCWSLCESKLFLRTRVAPGRRPPALEPGHIDLAVDRITGPPREMH
jgi:hypothetical protein